MGYYWTFESSSHAHSVSLAFCPLVASSMQKCTWFLAVSIAWMNSTSFEISEGGGQKGSTNSSITRNWDVYTWAQKKNQKTLGLNSICRMEYLYSMISLLQHVDGS